MKMGSFMKATAPPTTLILSLSKEPPARLNAPPSARAEASFDKLRMRFYKLRTRAAAAPLPSQGPLS